MHNAYTPNQMAFKQDMKKNCSTSISILITGVNDTGDKSLYMNISEYIHKNSKML